MIEHDFPAGAAAEEERREPKVSLRIIRRCNYACPYCSTSSSLTRPGKMRFADFRTAVRILADCGFHGNLNISGGEPSLHPRLPSMLEYASAGLPRAGISVFTNGEWVGRSAWQARLSGLLAGPNVLVRFSLDREHAEGALRAKRLPHQASVADMERRRMEKARLFLNACEALGAVSGRNYDFAFKGGLESAKAYMRDLGDVPVYTIRFRRDPDRRPQEYGFLAIDVDENDHVFVYPTLGHIPSGEPLGGLETLPAALEINRNQTDFGETRG